MKEALKLALEALRNSQDYKQGRESVFEAIEDIEAALAQPEQKPLAKVEPCAVCGEGKARLSVLRSCDTCHSEYAGQAEMKVALAQPDYRAVKTYHEGKPVYVSQPEQEPVAWTVVGDGKFGKVEIGQHAETDLDACSYWVNRGYSLVPLYTALPKRPWVGLTDAEMFEMSEFRNAHGYVPTSAKRLFARIEAKLKEKNT